MKLEYPEKTMYQMVEEMSKSNPFAIAYEIFGKKTSYKQFVERINRAARAFIASGIGPGDAVTICMPNTPQALDCFYALSRIGAIANMVHPMSAREEIVFYLNVSKSRMILTLDMFAENVENAVEAADHPVRVLIARMQENLNPVMAAAYTATQGKAFLKYPNTDHAQKYTDFLKKGLPSVKLPDIKFEKDRTAVILYSGGTSGVPKGICLTDYNFNSCAIQTKFGANANVVPGSKMLSCMPIFHGFGLGINIHTVLIYGGTCILMPSFNIKNYANMLIKKQPNFIAGVPTIFEALLHLPAMEKADLSCLQGVYCGGDSLSVELKKKVDEFLKSHKATVEIKEGYGLTECVTASCLTPEGRYKEGSIGLPFPDTVYCIVKPGTEEECAPMEEGEIILKGPSVMKEYLNNPEETAQTLRVLSDGNTWLYTGDLGCMDEEGYVFYKQRIKRLIITNGYNVYPGQVENAIDGCPEVAYCCVIGVKDPRRMHRVRAYVVLRDGYTGDDACRERIMNNIKYKVAGYALPKEIIFKEELPKTLVGKVHYRKLEEEANQEE